MNGGFSTGILPHADYFSVSRYRQLRHSNTILEILDFPSTTITAHYSVLFSRNISSNFE
jgi:hypothetical protein